MEGLESEDADERFGLAIRWACRELRSQGFFAASLARLLLVLVEHALSTRRWGFRPECAALQEPLKGVPDTL